MKHYGIDNQYILTAESVTTLPGWDTKYKRSFIFAEDVSKMYYGTNSGWEEWGSSGTSGTSGYDGLSGTSGTSGSSPGSYQCTSTSSVVIGLGSKSFVTTEKHCYNSASRVRAWNTSANWVEGSIQSWGAYSLTIDVDSCQGTGNTPTSWVLSIAGGTSGTSGVSGTSGTSGSGTSGTSGSGTSGTSGTSGIAGTSGTSGSSSTSGTSGTTSTSGTSGVAGTSGTSGTSGVAGTSGTSGTSAQSDIEYQFTPSASQTNANVTNLVFDRASYKAAIIWIYVYDATNSLIELFTLNVATNGAGTSWILDSASVGQNSKVTFSITTAGQVQYTNQTGWGTGSKFVWKTKKLGV